MGRAVPLPVAGMLGPPLPRTVVADLAVNRIRSNLTPMIFSPLLPMAIRGRTNGLLRMKARSAEGTMAKSARPLNHAPQSDAIPFQSEMCRNDLETAIEYYRVLANWGAFPPDPLGGRAAPRIPPAKPLTIGAPSDRPPRRNPSAALTADDSLSLPFDTTASVYTGTD